MAITLTEARAALQDSILHAGNDSYDDTKLDRAIVACGSEFLRETNCDTELVEFQIPSALFDVTAITGLENFISDQFFWMHLDDEAQDIFLVSYRDIIRKKAANATVGRPEFCSFASDTQIEVWPSPDALYDAKMLRRKPFVSFEIGTVTPDDVDINIPDEWVYSVLWSGGKYHLWGGAPGHPDAPEAKRTWDALIERAKSRFPSGRPGLDDRMSQRTRGG